MNTLRYARSPLGGALLRACLIVLALTAVLAFGRPSLVSATTDCPGSSTLYVNAAVGSSGNGATWPTAYKTLAEALTTAARCPSVTQIWVAQGTYTPTSGADSTATFQLRTGLAIYGGFTSGQSNLTDRNANPATNNTVLSGDLGSGNHSYHVVTGSGTDRYAILDGFTITGGNATSGSDCPGLCGGGMYNNGGSPTLTNVTFSGNSATHDGGGMYNRDGSPTLTNVTFSGNSARIAGGGMDNEGGGPTLTNVTFSGNSAARFGGGMDGGIENEGGSPTLTNVTFSGNSVGFFGGGMAIWGGSPILTNVTFSGNYGGGGGGGMYNSGSPTIRNSILWGDSGGEIVNDSGGSASVSYSIVQQTSGVYPGMGNFNKDPLFVTPITAPAQATKGNLRLQYASPAINAGTNSVADPSLPPTDLDGNPRVVGGTVDMGAYEYQGCPTGNGVILYVNASVVGGFANGQTWANAYPTLTAALAQANACASVTQIWVAQGTYKPTSGTDRSATFQLKNNLAVYGGFTSGQSSLSQRNANPATNNTVLSGDLNGDDGANFANHGENSYNVVTGSGTDGTAILDGFTVSGGDANNSSLGCPAACGGGMYNDNGSPTLTNVTFSGNSATTGGGILNNYGSPTLTNVAFSGNSATTGGGILNIIGSPTLTNVTFSGNSAYDGGAMFNSGGNPTLTNVTFSGNTAQGGSGGGMYSRGGNPKIRNSILWGDSGGEIHDYGSTPVVSNSIVQGSSAANWWSNNSITDGGGNLDADPKFIAPITASAPTTTGNLRLQSGSPAIDAGNNSVTSPPLPATDLDDNPRILGSAVDMGAYEFLCPPGTPSRLYVNAAVAGGTGAGDSWANASPTLAFALARALACPTPPLVTEIWVAQGTYRPTSGTDRSATFQLRTGLAVYGGFTSGQSNLTDRNANPATNNTVLSGDLNGDDGPNFANNGDNSYHVVTGSGTDNTAILDGFTISGGNANDSSNACPAACGGGMVNDYGSPTLTNVTFSGNSAADQDGGGMYDYVGSPTLTNVTFSGNKAQRGYGGGMANSEGSPRLTNVTFSGNSAGSGGGGMYNGGGSPTLTNITFSGNSASSYGGGMANSGGSPTLTNVTYSGNSATTGGGMAIYGANVTLTNVTFSGNSATTGGGMYVESAISTIRNSILWGDSGGEIVNVNNGSASVTYSVVQGSSAANWWSNNSITNGGHNLDADPLFITPITAPAPTTTGNLRLGLTSPAINAGNNSDIPSGVTTDLDGNPRIVYGVVDMGAYEAQVAVTKLSVSAPSSATQGSAFSVTVTAQDPNGVTVGAYLGTVHFTSSDLSAGLPTDYTFTAADAGAHTFTSGVTLNALGSQSITATDTSNSNVTGSASVNVVRPTTRVSSITRVGSNPTKAGSVSWTVTFANAVSGLTASNFTLAVTGLGGTSTIGTVTPTGSAPATTWTVTASTGTGDGSLGLNLTNDTGLSSQVTNTPFVGQVYTIDRTAPTITITTPTDGAVYLQGAPLTASYTCSDPGGSGVASCVGTVANGSPLSTATVGSFSFTVTATDNVGNTASQTVHYVVGYAVSYVSPLVGPPSVNSLYPTSIGTTATPVKWTLKNAAGQAITAAGTVTGIAFKLNSSSASCNSFTTDATGATAASVTSSNPKYDVMQKLWVYNWVLPGRGCYTLFVTLNSSQVVPLFYHIY
ncbi:MAG: choice-of-anchor Q domain-containing protein [Anaerolineae bacterium]